MNQADLGVPARPALGRDTYQPCMLELVNGILDGTRVNAELIRKEAYAQTSAVARGKGTGMQPVVERPGHPAQSSEDGSDKIGV